MKKKPTVSNEPAQLEYGQNRNKRNIRMNIPSSEMKIL